MPAPDLALIADAVKQAGDISTGFAGRSAQKWDKPGGAGPVTEADLAVNTYLAAHLLNARPDYGWLSEESEDSAERLSRDAVFIVDPIDGTRSFLEGSRTWAHSVAVAQQGVVTAGAIYLPLRDLLYTAALGEGAWLNGEPLTASGQDDLETAGILAAKPTLAAEHWPGGVPAFQRSHRPSLAYRLSLVGQGRFDGMLTLRPTWEWDIAAGTLIVSEATGVCTDRTGGALKFNNQHPQVEGLVAAGPKLHGALIRAMGQ